MMIEFEGEFELWTEQYGRMQASLFGRVGNESSLCKRGHGGLMRSIRTTDNSDKKSLLVNSPNDPPYLMQAAARGSGGTP